jgi:hypothetical protein
VKRPAFSRPRIGPERPPTHTMVRLTLAGQPKSARGHPESLMHLHLVYPSTAAHMSAAADLADPSATYIPAAADLADPSASHVSVSIYFSTEFDTCSTRLVQWGLINRLTHKRCALLTVRIMLFLTILLF